MRPRRVALAAVVALNAMAISGCALWFGKPPAPLAAEGLLASDKYMQTFGFTVMEDQGKPADFDRIERVYVKREGPSRDPPPRVARPEGRRHQSRCRSSRAL
jgi:hypothetical protein